MTDKILTRGIKCLTLLLIAFIVLKLWKVINWSWWLVFSPLWIPVILVLIIVTIAFLATEKEESWRD